jgi:ketosteroid isomerase-like protein
VSDNLDLVPSLFEDFERGEFGRVGWMDPEIEFVMIGGPEPGSWTGPAGMADSWRDWLSTWKDVRFGAEEYRELDEERIFVLLHVSRGRGKTSGLELRQVRTKGASLFHVRNGKVTRFVNYWDRDHALADLRLKE